METDKSNTSNENATDSSTIQPLRWSARLRSRGVSVNGSAISRTADGPLYTICCLAPFVPNPSGTIQKWSAKVTLKRWIAVGICQIEQALSHNFEKWDWRNTGNGLHCVVSNGIVYSNNNSFINYQKKSF